MSTKSDYPAVAARKRELRRLTTAQLEEKSQRLMAHLASVPETSGEGALDGGPDFEVDPSVPNDTLIIEEILEGRRRAKRKKRK